MKEPKDCLKCEETELYQDLEAYLIELDTIVRKLRNKYKRNLHALIDLERAVVSLHQEYEVKVNKFCNSKCGIDYPFILELKD